MASIPVEPATHCGRLLGADDLAKLGAILRRLESESPLCVLAVRLILFTGCRPGEIRRLRWCEVKPDRLALADAKTGPRHVLLGGAAHKLLDRLAETASGEWVFSSARHTPCSTSTARPSRRQRCRPFGKRRHHGLLLYEYHILGKSGVSISTKSNFLRIAGPLRISAQARGSSTIWRRYSGAQDG